MHVGIEVDHLTPRVDAAIGAASGVSGERCAGNSGEPYFQNILHRTAAGLRLPAQKTAAVVLESYGDAGNMGLG
jgi:hypothetical protein